MFACAVHKHWQRRRSAAVWLRAREEPLPALPTYCGGGAAANARSVHSNTLSHQRRYCAMAASLCSRVCAQYKQKLALTIHSSGFGRHRKAHSFAPRPLSAHTISAQFARPTQWPAHTQTHCLLARPLRCLLDKFAASHTGQRTATNIGNLSELTTYP